MIANCFLQLTIVSLEHIKLISLEGIKREKKCLYAAAAFSHLYFFHFSSSYGKSWALKWYFIDSGAEVEGDVYGYRR